MTDLSWLIVSIVAFVIGWVGCMLWYASAYEPEDDEK